MLEPDFTPPPLHVAQTETRRREALLPPFTALLSGAVDGLLMSGSMAYGANYAITPASDIDVQIIVRPDQLEGLGALPLFAESPEFHQARPGFEAGVFRQFSLMNLTLEGVRLECHFWDTDAFCAAVSGRTQMTPRYRADITGPSRDHGFSLAGDEHVQDYYGVILNGYGVSEFPSFRRRDGMLYLCRPMTNVLGCGVFLLANEEVAQAEHACWQSVVGELGVLLGDRDFEPETMSVVHALPGRSKMSSDACERVHRRTRDLLRGVVHQEISGAAPASVIV